MGTGAVGAWVGGCLAAAGVPVHFVVRPARHTTLQAKGLTLTDLEGRQTRLPPEALQLHPHPPDGLKPSLALLTVKSGDTQGAAAALSAALPAGTLVLSLQNGVDNTRVAQAAAPGLVVLPGMVPYNIAELSPGHLHRGTSGQLVAQTHPAVSPWLPVFAQALLPLKLVPDMAPVQWGKLLVNLNNPINALSGLPLREQLLDADLRRCFAALIHEALQVLKAAQRTAAPVTGLKPDRLVRALRLPTPVFRLLAQRMLRIDHQARSSMADDLRRGRVTEIDALCGAVVALAHQHGLRAPMNERVRELVRGWPHAPHPWTGRELWQAMASSLQPLRPPTSKPTP